MDRIGLDLEYWTNVIRQPATNILTTVYRVSGLYKCTHYYASLHRGRVKLCNPSVRMSVCHVPSLLEIGKHVVKFI